MILMMMLMMKIITTTAAAAATTTTTNNKNDEAGSKEIGQTIQKDEDPNAFISVVVKEPHINWGPQVMEKLEECQRFVHQRQIERVDVLQELAQVKQLQVQVKEIEFNESY